MADRIAQLQDAGMVFDDPPSQQIVERINKLSDSDFATLLSITPKLSVPRTGPTLRYQNSGFQFRSFEK